MKVEERELTLDEWLGQVVGHAQEVDHGEPCTVHECERQAVYIVWWGPDTRFPGYAQCFCYRRTVICLPCYDETTAAAVVGTEDSAAMECGKCGMFMRIVRSEPIRSAA